VCRNLDKRGFDYLIGILFEHDFTVWRACQVPVSVVLDHSRHSEHVNGSVLCLRESFWALPGVKDITYDLQEAQSTEDEKL